ncbi:MAG TPA: hypothetical protein VG538_17565 [Vicinamibacterales bacterium]|nr:hypothetical protein [Vicinamibacterales bacterium]
MKSREPWLGLASAAGLVVMLIGDGALDVVGLLIAIAPLAYGLAATIRRRERR